MKRQGLEKASHRLEAAKRELQLAHEARYHAPFQHHWFNFLAALDSIYNYLGQSLGGAKDSNAWYALLVKARKEDELLQYLMQARNAENHGIALTAERESGQVKIGGGGSEGFSRVMTTNFSTEPGMERIYVASQDGKPIKVDVVEPATKLLSVVNRGKAFQQPKSHLGRDIQGISAIDAGQLAIEFFEAKMVEAWKLSAEG